MDALAVCVDDDAWCLLLWQGCGSVSLFTWTLAPSAPTAHALSRETTYIQRMRIQDARKLSTSEPYAQNPARRRKP